MDYLKSVIDDLGCNLYLLIAAVVVLGALYLNDLRSERGLCDFDKDNPFSAYGYNDYNGPSVWSRKYPSAAGSSQSPINVQEANAIVISSGTVPLLVFSSDFHCLPYEMTIYNNGHNVIVYGSWCNGKKPSLLGGPLNEDYNFLNICFRWGPNDFEGSEHMINSSRYAMELQASFVNGTSEHENILDAAASGSLLILSYVFMVTPLDNPYMEPIVNSLKYLKCPMSCIRIEPVILSLLMPDFSSDYYTYIGSLTFPPCTEGVRWIVKPEPLMISSKQVKTFRKLHGCTGRIETNTRPVQKTSLTDLFYYE